MSHSTNYNMSLSSSTDNFQKIKSYCQLTENSRQCIIMLKGKKSKQTKHTPSLTPSTVEWSNRKTCQREHITNVNINTHTATLQKKKSIKWTLRKRTFNNSLEGSSTVRHREQKLPASH